MHSSGWGSRLTPAGPLLQLMPIDDPPAAGAAPLAGRQATGEGFTKRNPVQLWEAGPIVVVAATEAAAVGVGRHSSEQPPGDIGQSGGILNTDSEAHALVAD